MMGALRRSATASSSSPARSAPRPARMAVRVPAFRTSAAFRRSASAGA